MTTPPVVSGGLPVVGHAFEMLNNRDALFQRGYQEHGDLFAVKLGPKYALIVTGAEHNRLVYTQTDKSINMQEGYAFLQDAVGSVLFTATKEEYYNQRPVLQETFRRERMVAYIRAMYIEAQRWLDTLGQSGEMDFMQGMLRLTQYVAGHAFIGPNFRDELGEDFWEQYDHVGESINPIVPSKWPIPANIRRDIAKGKIFKALGTLIEKRRQNPEQYDDLISTLLTTPQADGTTMSDQTIVSMFTAFIFAGHETTAGQAAWTVALLLQNPEYLALVKEEIAEKVPYGAPIDASLLSRLETVFWAIDETTRLRPSADTQIRTVSETMTIGDYTVPAGWQVMVNATNSHNLPEVFSNPEQYDPTRFSPERGEGKNPFAIIGFGGGIHKCTGMNFARNEMAIITSLLFQQFDVELLSDDIKVVMGHGANHPDKVRVRYQRKPVQSMVDEGTIREALAAGCPHIKQQVEAQQG